MPLTSQRQAAAAQKKAASGSATEVVRNAFFFDCRFIVKNAVLQEGAFALCFKSKHFPGECVASRRGSPLLVGIKSASRLTTDHVPILYGKGTCPIVTWVLPYHWLNFFLVIIRILLNAILSYETNSLLIYLSYEIFNNKSTAKFHVKYR